MVLRLPPSYSGPLPQLGNWPRVPTSPQLFQARIGRHCATTPVGLIFRIRVQPLAQAARSPGQAAARATHAARASHTADAATDPDPDPAATDPDPAATEPAAATTAATATTAAAEPAAAAATSAAAAAPMAAAATTASAGYLHAAANAFPIEEMERRETDVGHFLFAKNEALIGRDLVRLRDISSGRRGCGCAARERKT